MAVAQSASVSFGPLLPPPADRRRSRMANHRALRLKGQLDAFLISDSATGPCPLTPKFAGGKLAVPGPAASRTSFPPRCHSSGAAVVTAAAAPPPFAGAGRSGWVASRTAGAQALLGSARPAGIGFDPAPGHGGSRRAGGRPRLSCSGARLIDVQVLQGRDDLVVERLQGGDFEHELGIDG